MAAAVATAWALNVCVSVVWLRQCGVVVSSVTQLPLAGARRALDAACPGVRAEGGGDGGVHEEGAERRCRCAKWPAIATHESSSRPYKWASLALSALTASSSSSTSSPSSATTRQNTDLPFRSL